MTSFPLANGKIHEVASSGVFAGSRHHFVQLTARLGISLHLPIPIVVRPGMKQCLQLATLLRRELFNRPFDFSNCAHGTKLSAVLYGVNLMPAGAATRLLRPPKQSTSAPDPSTINAQPSTTPAGLFSVDPVLRPPARLHKPGNGPHQPPPLPRHRSGELAAQFARDQRRVIGRQTGIEDRCKQSLVCNPPGRLSQLFYRGRTFSKNSRKAVMILPQSDGVIFPSCRTIVVFSMVANLSTRTIEGSRNPARCHCVTVTSKPVRATWLVIGATSRSASTES